MVLIQIGTIDYRRWLSLKDIAPEKYHPLLDYCIKLIEEARHIQRIGPEFVTSAHFRQITILGLAVLAEYNKFIYNGNLPKEELTRVETDVKGSLRVFFDNTGKPIDFSIYISRRSTDEISNYTQVLFAQLISFIETRVYYPILNSYEKCLASYFDSLFLIDTKLKAGVYTKAPEKPELSDLKPDDGLGEEPEKKSKKKKEKEE